MEDAQLTIKCTNCGTHGYTELAVLSWSAELRLVGAAQRGGRARPMHEVTPPQPVTVHGKPATVTTGKFRLRCKRCPFDLPLRQETAVRLFERADQLGMFEGNGRVATIEGSLAAKLVSV